MALAISIRSAEDEGFTKKASAPLSWARTAKPGWLLPVKNANFTGIGRAISLTLFSKSKPLISGSCESETMQTLLTSAPRPERISIALVPSSVQRMKPVTPA